MSKNEGISPVLVFEVYHEEQQKFRLFDGGGLLAIATHSKNIKRI